MKKIVIGKKDKNIKYDFRETCFGIVYKNNMFYLTNKKGELSLIGGGIEENEEVDVCLSREFMEEAGLTIIKISEFITVDCYWITRNSSNMNSLANFYIVEVDDLEKLPTEEGHEITMMTALAFVQL